MRNTVTMTYIRNTVAILMVVATPLSVAKAQLGVKLAADPIPPRTVMGNPGTAPAAPAAMPLPDCKADEALTVKGGLFSCVAMPSGGTGGLVVTNGLRLNGNVLSLTSITEDKSAADYTVAATDNVKTLLVGARTYTLPQAGTAGFADEWGMCFANQTDSSTASIVTTASTFTGAPGAAASQFKLPPKQAACVTSYTGNYNTFMVR